MDLSIYKAKPDKSIREHTDDLLNNLEYLKGLGYIKDEKILNLTKIACEYHDFGKVNREFQYRIKHGTDFNTEKEIAHNLLSLYFINPEEFDSKEDYYRVCFAVLFHHYYYDDNLKTLIEEKELIEDLLSDFEIYKLKPNTPKRIGKIRGDNEAVLVKGFVNKCDFSASGGTKIEYINDFLDMSLENLLSSWKAKNKNASWNELQNFCKNNSNENIIVVAQTGMGKTEAGLHWIGDNKGFFILPLKTAINAIYKRISEDIVSDEIEHKVALIHSDTLSYYNDNSHKNIDILTYKKEGKQLAIPLNITTLDQIFDFVLKYKGYEMKAATLSYSKVVIDEIQMYSADLLAYLIYGVKSIIKLGGKVAILTATLAPFIKDLLIGEDNEFNFKESTFVNDLKRHNIKTYKSKINSQIIFDKYKENKERGISNKILVVCNTIKKAQEIYKELSEKGIENLEIFHSKFIKKDRAGKEDKILRFGKTDFKGDGIWISTQIVEASLDIDFDYLFTELSDINGLFQRLGRCNRKGEKSVDNHNCFIFLEVDDNILTKGNKGFIDRKIYELSKEALKNKFGVLSEQEKVEIIKNTLTTENIKNSKYYEEYIKFSDWINDVNPYEIDKKDAKLRNIVSFDIMPESIYQENIEKINECIDKLKDINIIKLERIKIRDTLKSFTVSVGKYDLEVLGKSALYKEIEISEYEKIPVIKCEYGELGFIRNKVEDNNIYDNFL
ncbi:MAG: CRISPR-associated helicase Cas3' [Clostridium baratii]|uniref:CRISPR-associated helicase Cas3' n=1 Tax=Clostridium baratii TaxID=1561 RepID=UPI00242CDA17|nr:CRISPR-associated helicase Cas3' [Clostridium baratii]MBS6005974.1 CRISPR-associated helicase Cas3' [Clostridium baratii]MDU4911719.1 CRISPR-associated helicase Cas3' [Clostridium baratii]